MPGPPPRTSIDATAGLSKMTAVTPDASLASSAWPTRTPAISVSRFFKRRPSKPHWSLATGIAAGENASTAKRHPDHAGKLGLAVGFCQ